MNDMLLEYIDRMIDQEKDHRVFPVEFNDKTYYVKQDISNHLLLIMSSIKFPL